MVSVIIPAYNAEKYLRECLDSAVGQIHRDIEIIVVDDGSTDSTAEIVGEYVAADSRVKLIRQANAGVSASRNAAMSRAEGEWIVFLDSDDVLRPDCISTLLDIAVSGCSKLVYGDWRGGSDCSAVDFEIDKRSTVSIDAIEVIEQALYQTSSIVPSPWGKLYHRDLFDDIRFDESLIYEDLDIFYKLADKAGRISVTNAPIYFYRKNPDGLTGTFRPSRLDVLDVTRRIEEYISARYPALLPAARDRRLSANFNMYCLLSLHDRDHRHAAVARDCWHIIRTYRRECLFNPRVRLKNKIGILVSYFGQTALRLLSPLVYGSGK